jgi:hypothetical protein
MPNRPIIPLSIASICMNLLCDPIELAILLNLVGLDPTLYQLNPKTLNKC